MKESIRNKLNSIEGLIGRLAAQKKKTAVAFLLVFVMVFMWVKVLVPNVPESAAASVVSDTADESEPKLKITYIELPVVHGRNDVLTRDFFTVGKGFLNSDVMVDVVTGGESEDLTRHIAEKLKLEAIVLGNNPQAFINDKLVSEGDRLVLREGTVDYEFTVVKIAQDKVIVKYKDVEIALKIASGVEETD
jgi:hypothetical protein